MQTVGTVAIGRNEGLRLLGCFQSSRAWIASGLRRFRVKRRQPRSCPNTWRGSCCFGHVDGIHRRTPRNVGFQHVCQIHPDIEFVQFVDGDCVLDPGWLPLAMACLQNEPSLAVICGGCRERYPEASIYNRLCDMEWDTPSGLVDACGGNALMRRSAFESVGGFHEKLIAGKEPELCLRLRNMGWTIRRIDAEMTLHEAATTRSSQWLKRAIRAGHAFAEGALLHRAEGMGRRECQSILFWGLIFLLVVVTAACFTGGASLLLVFPFLMLKILLGCRRQSGLHHTPFCVFACVIGKFPQALGLLTSPRNRMRERRSRLLENKASALRPNA